MPLPLVGSLLRGYNNLPAIPPTEPLGDLLNSLYTGQNTDSFKQPVRLATNVDIALAGVGFAIDGVNVAAGDRVLVKEQTNQAENGIYVAAAGAWSRSADADTSANLVPATYVIVEEGVKNKDLPFTLLTDAPITVGTTPLVFRNVSESTDAWKRPVRVTATTAISLSGVGANIDGVSVAAGDRVLAARQANAADNGIYVVSTGNWQRAPDADSSESMIPAMVVLTSEGDVNDNRAFILTTNAPITLGVTDLIFEDFGGGLTTFKQPVRLASTANLALSGTGGNIDGVGLNAGDRILVKDQADPTENGIYVVSTGSWSRSFDARNSNTVQAGLFAFVTEGDTNADKAFLLTTNDPITVGVTALNFILFDFERFLAIETLLTAAGDITTNNQNFVDVPGMSYSVPVDGDYVGIFTTEVEQDTAGGSVEINMSVNNIEQTNTRRTFRRGADNIRVTHSTMVRANGLSAGDDLEARWRKQPAGGSTATMGNRSLLVMKVG